MPLLPANHVLFQLANLFLGFSYLAFNLLSLRIILSIANLFFVLWAWLILDYALDTILWNALFIALNMGQISLILYRARPIKFDHEAHETIYERLFRPVGISRLDFKQLAAISLCRSLKAGSHYIEAGNTAHSLSIVRSGILEVIKPIGDSGVGSTAARLNLASTAGVQPGAGVVINNIYPFEFIESPEFASRGKRRLVKEYARRMQKKGSSKAGLARQDTSSDLRSTPTRRSGRSHGDPTQYDVDAGMIAIDMMGDKVVEEDDGDDDNDTGDLAFEEQDESHDSAIGVTIRAKTDCAFLMWPMDNLEYFLRKNGNLSAPVYAVVGQDIANKLFRQTEGNANKLKTGAGLVKHHGRERGPLSSWKLNQSLSREQQVVVDTFHRVVHSQSSKSNPLDPRKSNTPASATDGVHQDTPPSSHCLDPDAFSSTQVLQLLQLGRWREFHAAGGIFCQEGEDLSTIAIVTDGIFEFCKRHGNHESVDHSTSWPSQDRQVLTCGQGALLGSIEYTQHPKPGDYGVRASHTIRSLGHATIFQWDKHDISPLLSTVSNLESMFAHLIMLDMTDKFSQIESEHEPDQFFDTSQ